MIKKFNEFIKESNFTETTWIRWSNEVSQEDIDKYERKISDMMDINDLDGRMDAITNILSMIENENPDIYDDVEDSIKDLAID